MQKSRYIWHITFDSENFFDTITIQENHPDFKSLLEYKMVQAELVDLDKICYISEDIPDEAILYSFDFKDGVILNKIFRRVENKLFEEEKMRTIPAIEFTKDGITEFIFIFKDKAIRTTDRRFYREDW